MGLLDGIIGKVAGSVLSGQGGEQGQAMALIGALMQQSGGIGNLFSQLQQGGLGDALSSWIGKGENQSVDASSISDAIGGDMLSNIASKVGVDQGTAGNLLAQYLPNVINNITPNGDAAEANQFNLADGFDMKDITALASKFLK